MIVTITAKEGRKIIDQVDVNIPSKAKWIAQDEDGEFIWFKLKPYPNIDLPYWRRTGNIKGILDYSHIWKINPDWRDTLIKVSDIK